MIFVQQIISHDFKYMVLYWRGGKMSRITAFNKTLEYLENCLDNEVDEEKVRRISGYSYALFARVFAIISGITLSDYLRYRKLSKAAIDIASSQWNIIDIAMKYGYESHNSFTTAFKNYHKITPSEVRKGYKYKIFTPMHFSLSVEGGNTMDIKIEKKAAFSIAGISMKVRGSGNFAKLWQELMESYDESFLSGMGNGCSYGSCFDFQNQEEFSYMAGFDVRDEKQAKANGLEILKVPEADYAIIPLKGKIPDCIHEGWKYVMGTFLPENGLKHSGTPDFEVYGEGDIYSDEYTMQLWVPVGKDD